MTILLDANACIAIINGKPAAVRSRLYTQPPSSLVLVPSIVVFELHYGVGKSQRIVSNTDRLEKFLSVTEILPFDRDDARLAGSIRAELEAIGKPIGSYDYLIAAQALRRNLVLITANVGEFSRVKGLRWENWTTP